jgi:hypothetical protein
VAHLSVQAHYSWVVERCFGWMDNYRRLVVRYERSVAHYKALCLIAIILWAVQKKFATAAHAFLRSPHNGFSVGLRAVVMYPGGSTSADSNETSDEDQR